MTPQATPPTSQRPATQEPDVPDTLSVSDRRFLCFGGRKRPGSELIRRLTTPHDEEGQIHHSQSASIKANAFMPG